MPVVSDIRVAAKAAGASEGRKALSMLHKAEGVQVPRKVATRSRSPLRVISASRNQVRTVVRAFVNLRVRLRAQ